MPERDYYTEDPAGIAALTKVHTPTDAEHDIKAYARALRTGNVPKAVSIEKKWGLYGYTPEIVSTVLACVATGLPLDAAIEEATGGAA